MNLQDRHAVVTGGGSGVGAAIALELARQGARVTIVGRRPEPLAEVSAHDDNIWGTTADVTDREAFEAALSLARERSGPIDIMVASAGASSSKPFKRLAVEDFDELMDINLHGVFHAFQLGLADTSKSGWGRLVAIASTAGLKGYAYVAHYCASKHAVVGMVRALALELGASGVTVNAVAPSFVDTPMTDQTVANIVATTGRTEDEAIAALVADNPQGRLITPEEVAHAVAYLCSDGAASVNGQIIRIDGGEV